MEGGGGPMFPPILGLIMRNPSLICFFFRFIGPVLRKKKYSTKSNGNPVRQKLGKTRQAINQTVEKIYATTGRLNLRKN